MGSRLMLALLAMVKASPSARLLHRPTFIPPGLEELPKLIQVQAKQIPFFGVHACMPRCKLVFKRQLQDKSNKAESQSL